MAVIPKTRPIFAMLDPITFPKEIKGYPSIAAWTLTNNSGAEVANETTVNPITILDKWNFKESATDERTKNSPPTTNNVNPNRMKTIFIYININSQRYYFIHIIGFLCI